MTHLDLFAGIGGFSIGLERTGGFETIAFCEQDPFCQVVLTKHWPGVPIFPDVRTLQRDDVGNVDVITAGFPCQDISVAGHGGGLDGERSGLFFQASRLIGVLRPRYAILENVGALLVRGFDRVLGEISKIGYDAEWCVVPAYAVGLPHQRERVFILAYPNGTGLEIRPSVGGNTRTQLATTERSCHALGNPDSQRGSQRQGCVGEVRRSEVVRHGTPLLQRLPECLAAARSRRRATLLRGYDGTIRAVDPSVPLLAHGIRHRSHKLRATGNAIVPEIAWAIGMCLLNVR